MAIQEKYMGYWSWLSGAICGLFTATTLYAGAVSLLETGSKPRTALITVSASVGHSASAAPSSLFIGREGSSLFAEVERAESVMALVSPRTGGMSGPAVTVIREIIEQAESSRSGYDAVQHGARIKPPALPTQMTVAEIYQWIEETPGQPHAIGRYQFIPPTLKRVMQKIEASPQQLFSRDLQDRLADELLKEAGYHEAKSGEMTRRAFMNNLAKIWAGLPNDTGQSHYHGFAGNKASMSWDRFDAQMAQVFVK
jgi:muramidase (phage lysozyme)